MPDPENNITRLVRAFLASAQDIENTLAQLLTMRTLDTAIGVQLDVIGTIVGQPRNGMDDTDYRRFCRARILVHRSNGTTDELIAIAKLILNITATGKIFVRTVDDATFILEVRDLAVTDPIAVALQSLLCAATSAGVRIVIVYAAQSLAQTFRLDGVSGQGLDQGKLAAAVDAASSIA